LGGIPLLAGFWSKDEILAEVSQGRHTIFIVGALVVALLSALYMARAMWAAFYGELKMENSQVKESPLVMTLPMALLAVLAAGFGLISFDWPGDFQGLGSFVFFGEAEAFHFIWWLGALSGGLALAAFAAAYLVYRRGIAVSAKVRLVLGDWVNLVENKYYFDEAYQCLVDRVVLSTSALVALFDRAVVNDLAVDGPANGLRRLGFILRLHVTGHLYSYGLAMILGSVGLAVFWWLQSV